MCGDAIHIIVFSFNISDENKMSMERLSTHNVKIEVRKLCITDYQDKFSLIKQHTHVTPTSLIKFDLPYLCSDVSTLLYIDSDIIIKNDIIPLFKIDLSEYHLAASFELWSYLSKNTSSNNRVDDITFYFNSGVLLLNLDKMRNDNIPSKLWNKKYELLNNPEKKRMDQDSFNEVCQNSTLPLPIIYNFNVAFYNEKYINAINLIYNTNYKSLPALLEDVCILHYVGKEDKPWVYESSNLCGIWDYYYLKLGNNLDLLNRIRVSKPLRYVHILKSAYDDKGSYQFAKYIIYKLYYKIIEKWRKNV